MKGFDVTAFFDAAAEGAIADLWRMMRETAADAMHVSLGTRPHLTLGIYEVDSPSDVESILAKVAKVTLPVRITIDEIVSAAAGDTGVLYLRPQHASDLKQFHQRVFIAFKDAGVVPIRRHWPDQWLPHVTLAKGIPTSRLSQAHVALSSKKIPGVVTLNSIGLVTFNPPQEQFCTKLGD